MKRILPLAAALALGPAALLALDLLPLRLTHVRPMPSVLALLGAGAGASPLVTSDAGTLGEALGGRRDRANAEVRRRLREAESGTYIGEILQHRDSALSRWPERVENPLRVWIQPTSAVADWRPEFVVEAERAFAEWATTNIPVRFAFSGDSAGADVRVTWIDSFSEPISGKTRWARDERYWITDADLQIAVHHNRGQVLDRSAVRAITLHEVGHLLGLDHSSDATTIMTPRVRVRALSAADRATMELLYSLPPGPVR